MKNLFEKTYVEKHLMQEETNSGYTGFALILYMPWGKKIA